MEQVCLQYQLPHPKKLLECITLLEHHRKVEEIHENFSTKVYKFKLNDSLNYIKQKFALILTGRRLGKVTLLCTLNTLCLSL